MSLELNDLKPIKFYNKKIMILGNSFINEESFADKIIIDIITNLNYKSGAIITNAEKIKDFYSMYSDTNEKIKPEFLYKRYTFLLKNRIFRENHYLVLDNYVLNSQILNEICENLTGKMLSLFYYPYFIKNIDFFDFVILTNTVDSLNLSLIYKIIKTNYDLSFDEFYKLVEDLTDDSISLVVNIKKIKMYLYFIDL